MARGRVSGNKVFSLLVSMTLSFCLWLVLAGQNTSLIDLTVPLQLVNLPEDLAVMGEVPNTVTLQVAVNTAQSRFLADRKLSLPLDVASAHEGPGNIFPVPFNALELPRGVQVREVTPSLIEFSTMRLAQKTVPVQPVILGRLNEYYRIKSQSLTPPEITIRGPEKLVEEIQSIATTPINIEGLDSNFRATVLPSLGDRERSLKLSVKEIKIEIIVEEKMRRSSFAKIPISLDFKFNELTEVDIRLSSRQLRVSVAWPLSLDREINADELTALVAVNERALEREGALDLPVAVFAPEGVSVTAVEPSQVTVSWPAWKRRP